MHWYEVSQTYPGPFGIVSGLVHGRGGCGDTPIDGDTVLELLVSELSMQLLAEQDGFLLVGDGYTVTKITVE